MQDDFAKMNPEVVKVRPESDYMLALWFSNGEKKRFDMKPYLDYEVFRPLKDIAIFCSATIFLGNVVWPNNSDLSYDTLYLEAMPSVA